MAPVTDSLLRLGEVNVPDGVVLERITGDGVHRHRDEHDGGQRQAWLPSQVYPDGRAHPTESGVQFAVRRASPTGEVRSPTSVGSAGAVTMTGEQRDSDGPESEQRRQWVASRRADLVDEVQAHRWRNGLLRSSTPHHTDWSSRHWTSRGLHRVGEVVANAATGIIAAALVVVWVAVGAITEFPHWWETVLYSATASVTFVMVFVIQHTQSRQTTALQRKLDELIRATADTDQSLIAVEEAPDEELRALADLNLGDRSETSTA
jgi:low affinity Fe/Cu permease